MTIGETAEYFGARHQLFNINVSISFDFSLKFSKQGFIQTHEMLSVKCILHLFTFDGQSVSCNYKMTKVSTGIFLGF